MFLSSCQGPAKIVDMQTKLAEAAHGEFCPNFRASYYRARYYDSNTGRFLSEDPIQFSGGTNFYIYAGNAPARFIDPSGTELQPDARETWNDYRKVGVRNLMKAQAFASEAANAAADWARQQGLPPDSLHNGPPDAFRHCFWSCTMTRFLGEDVAETVADEHEKRNNRRHEQTPDEEKMDRTNNLRGRTAALECKDKGKSCWDLCSELYNQHRLVGLGARPDYFPGVPGHANH